MKSTQLDFTTSSASDLTRTGYITKKMVYADESQTIFDYAEAPE
jgi:hypothetical protein